MPHVVAWTLQQTPLREVPDITWTTCRNLHSYSFQTVPPTGWWLPGSSTKRHYTSCPQSLSMLRKTRNYFITSCETISDLPHILVPRDRNKILVDILAVAMINLKAFHCRLRPPPASTSIIATSSKEWYLNGAQSQDSQYLIHNRETLHVFIILSTFSQHIPSSEKKWWISHFRPPL